MSRSSGGASNGASVRAGTGAVLLLVLGGSVVGLLFGELALRFAGLPSSAPFLQEFRGERFKLMCYDRDPTGAQDLDLSDPAIRVRYGPRLFDSEELEQSWTMTPNAVAFEFNSLGFREEEFAPRRTGAQRVAIVGDSFTVGHGLSESDSYPRRLESLLRKQGEAPRAEVLNLGRGDTDFLAISRVARFAMERLRPDILVYGYFLNDALRSRQPDEGVRLHDMLDAGWIEIQQTHAVARIGGIERGPSRVVDLLRRFVADRDVTTATLDWYRQLHRREDWEPTRRGIEKMAEAASRRGTRFVLLVLPLPFRIDGDYPFDEAHREIVRAAEASGIAIIDALEVLRSHPAESLRLHPRDLHPSPLYARLVAELLARELGSSLTSAEATGSQADRSDRADRSNSVRPSARGGT